MNILINQESLNKFLSDAIDINKYNLNSTFKLSSFVIEDKIGETIILYNAINSFLAELTYSEYKYVLTLSGKELLQSNYSALIYNYILVPQDFDVSFFKDYVETQVWNKTPIEEFFNKISSYVIFTTTDCNARCFYCYERGTSKIKMSKKTAEDVANFIVNEYTTNELEEIHIEWFGGEPLYNIEAIDTIVDILAANNVKFTSTMISNSLLFTPQLCHTAKTKWNLTNIQITLDGTKDVYNKIKNYINLKPEDNPFETVITNTKCLLSEGIHVSIRLNAELYNIDDLKILIKYLDREIGHPKNFSVYIALLFEKISGIAHTEEELSKLYLKVEELMMFSNYYKYNFVENTIKRANNLQRGKHCMIDSGNSITILPDGKISSCEHFTDKNLFGSIYTPKKDWDYELVKKMATEIHEKNGKCCKDCPFYSVCRPVSYCETERICSEEQFNLMMLSNKLSLRNKYYSIKNRNTMNNNCDNQSSYHLNRIANELELLNDYKSLTLWERIKILLGMTVYRDPHKIQQTDYNNKSKES